MGTSRWGGNRKFWVNKICFHYSFGGDVFCLAALPACEGVQSARHDERIHTLKLTKIAVFPDMSASADMVTVPLLKIPPPEERSNSGNRGKSGEGACNLHSRRRIPFQRTRIFHGFGALV